MSILKDSFIQYIIKFLKSKIEAKQDKLVSGSNIKTINGTSVLGSGDITIEGGGSIDTSGNYPNMTVGKATKLATPRKIGLTGGAVGTGTNFDGSGDVKIPVTKIDDSYITWTGSNKKAFGSVTDNLMKNGQQNSFAFMPPNAVTVEYTNDSGATWLDYGLTDDDKTRFLTPLVGTKFLYVGKDGKDLADTAQLRITLDFIEAGMQLELRKIMLRTQMFSGSTNGEVRIKILSELYSNYNTDTWQEFIDVTVANPGWMSLPVTNTDSTWGYKGNNYPSRLRVIFYRTGTPAYNTSLISMVGLSNVVQNGNDIAKYCWPCVMDVSKNATFPNAITATKHITKDGTSNQVVLGNGDLAKIDELGVGMALEADHAVSADIADKAEKLTNARTISLSGGATSTAVAFDGSKNIDIPVTSLKENALVWSTDDIQNGATIMDSMFRDTIGNRLAFCNPAAITIEHSQDGGNTWVSIDNDADKIKLVTPVLGDNYFTIGGSLTPPNKDVVQTRVTIDAITAKLYFKVNKILIKTIGVTGVDSATGKPTYCRIEYQTYGNYGTDTWTTYKDIEVIGQPGWNSISTNGLPNFGYASSPHIRLIRFTLYKPNGCGQHIGRLSNIAFLSLNIVEGGNTFSKTGHIYGIDVNQNATFPANVTATKHITQGGTANQVVLGDGSLRPISELSPITDADAEILLDNHIHSIDVYANGNDVNISVIESSKNGNTWETEDKDIPIPLATTTSAGVMSKEDKNKLDSLSTSAGRGMTIPGTVNLTNGTFNTQNNSSLNSYTKVFGDMSVGEMRMYLVADSSGNLPSTSETAVTVPHDGILSPAQVYFGKSAAFGVSVGDICVLFKKSSLLNICRIIPLNDVKPSNGDFPGADGLSTVWDKNRINKIDGIEWTANHVRDNYLPKSDRFPSRTDWLINVNYCVDNGVYPTCDAASMQVGLVNNYVTLIVHRTSTVDNGGFDTVEQTAYGRGADEGKIYKRIIFYYGSSTEYGDWKRIDLDNTYTKEEVDTKIGDINTILESIINN